MKKKEITISGMTCGHCVKAIIKALGGIPGLTLDEVQVGKATIQVDESKVSDELLKTAVEQAGYQIVSIQ
jgi:copper chaperone CopZ